MGNTPIRCIGYSKVIMYDRERNNKNDFEIPAFLNFE